MFNVKNRGKFVLVFPVYFIVFFLVFDVLAMYNWYSMLKLCVYIITNDSIVTKQLRFGLVLGTVASAGEELLKMLWICLYSYINSQ